MVNEPQLRYEPQLRHKFQQCDANKKLIVLVLFLSLFFISTSSISAASYYVAPTGSDSNAGSSSAPWKTVTKAVGTAPAGSTIHVASGTYSPFSFSDKIVECGSIRTCISNNTISLKGGATLRGWLVDGANQHAGIELYVGNNVAEDNEVKRGIQCPKGVSCPSYADADGFRFFGPNNIMRRNYIHDFDMTNSQNTNPHADCFQTWADSATHIAAINTIIEYNICNNFSANSTGGLTQGIEMDNARGTIVRNNYIRVYGKKMDIDVANQDTTIENNIFVGGPIITNTTLRQDGIFNNGGTNTVVKNNIFFDIRDSGSTPWIYNVSSQSNNLPKDATNSHPVLPGTDPKLDANYHPFAGSPVCGKGINGVDIGPFPCGGVSQASLNSTSPKFGDVNGDGFVDLVDIGILIDNYGKSTSTYPRSDLNSDSVINIVDIGIVISNYGK